MHLEPMCVYLGMSACVYVSVVYVYVDACVQVESSLLEGCGVCLLEHAREKCH